MAYVSESPAANSKVLVHDGRLALHLYIGFFIVAAYLVSFDRSITIWNSDFTGTGFLRFKPGGGGELQGNLVFNFLLRKITRFFIDFFAFYLLTVYFSVLLVYLFVFLFIYLLY